MAGHREQLRAAVSLVFDEPFLFSDTIAANLQLPVDEKQDLLETVDPLERLNRIGDILEIEHVRDTARLRLEALMDEKRKEERAHTVRNLLPERREGSVGREEIAKDEAEIAADKQKLKELGEKV